MVRDTGFEPVTPTMSMWCSTPELTAHDIPINYTQSERYSNHFQLQFLLFWIIG
jgi:hypothetical protein